MGRHPDGKLLALIYGSGCEVFLTCDQNMEYQQNLGAQPFAAVVFRAPNKKMETLIPLVPQLLALLPTVRPGQVYYVGKSAEALLPCHDDGNRQHPRQRRHQPRFDLNMQHALDVFVGGRRFLRRQSLHPNVLLFQATPDFS